MSAGVVQLHAGSQITGTGTVSLDHMMVAGYVITDGTNEGNIELRDGSDSGPILFKWDSPVPTAFWPVVCPSGTMWYSVAGTGCYVMYHGVVI